MNICMKIFLGKPLEHAAVISMSIYIYIIYLPLFLVSLVFCFLVIKEYWLRRMLLQIRDSLMAKIIIVIGEVIV